MTPSPSNQWQQLAEQASNEMDPDKLLNLLIRLNPALLSVSVTFPAFWLCGVWISQDVPYAPSHQAHPAAQANGQAQTSLELSCTTTQIPGLWKNSADRSKILSPVIFAGPSKNVPYDTST